MKFRGTKLTGSSILTVLGVVCFATILVAAAMLGRSTLQETKTVTDTGLEVIVGTFADQNADISSTSTPVKGDPYDFQVSFTTTIADADGVYKIIFTGCSAADSVSIKWWDSSDTPAWSSTGVTYNLDVSTLTVTVATGHGFTLGANTQGFQVIYNDAGSYQMQVEVWDGAA